MQLVSNDFALPCFKVIKCCLMKIYGLRKRSVVFVNWGLRVPHGSFNNILNRLLVFERGIALSPDIGNGLVGVHGP
jgi:hypothetical protein